MPNAFRPWGTLDWVMPKLGGQDWSILGVVGTEDRCTAALEALNPVLIARRFLKIIDPHMSPQDAFEARYLEMQARFIAAHVSDIDIRSVDLLQDIDTIEEEVNAFIGMSGPRVVLDITSMPKRWFFPVLRLLSASAEIETLLVTYTSAGAYGEQLSSDPSALAPLPTFDVPRADDSYDELIIGVGFAPLGLKDMFAADVGRIRYLFPFPPGPPNFFRNWHFLRALEAEIENRSSHVSDRWHVNMYDVSTAFDALCQITNDGINTSALAPYGPKTISLAMCLFALAAENAAREPVHVYYTQPRRYAIDYTTGIQTINGLADIKAYCLRINGRDLYAL